MKTAFSPRHISHSGNVELAEGNIVPAFEKPSRAEFIVERIKAVSLGEIRAPEVHGLKSAAKVHRQDYLDFLPTVYPKCKAQGRAGTALPFACPARGLRGGKCPDFIDGQLGYYSFDAGAGFVEGTWDAIQSSKDTAISAASLVNSGERAAFALCRPPGHHAGSSFMGGYCYINNSAVAAQYLLGKGAQRVSILDIDYHHGNGTQEIFYSRADVQVINLHADPMVECPYFLGHADERGEGAGEGFNINYPMPFGTSFDAWSAALEDACGTLKNYGPDVVLVSIGVDTFEKDPISKFKLKTADYPKVGARIARLGLPTLFVMEGGRCG